MHIVVTNLCVWYVRESVDGFNGKSLSRFRMVVIETTSQIMETRMEEMLAEQLTSGYPLNGK